MLGGTIGLFFSSGKHKMFGVPCKWSENEILTVQYLQGPIAQKGAHRDLPSICQ